VIVVRDSKFGKSRLVPLHASAVAALAAYAGNGTGSSHGRKAPRSLSLPLARLCCTATSATRSARSSTRPGWGRRAAQGFMTSAILRRENPKGAGVDTSVIALWLGHADIRATSVYLHADMTIKERALALTTPASVRPPGATTRLTPCSPSSRACDYADLTGPPHHRHARHRKGLRPHAHRVSA
jgi:integrase